MDKVYVKHYILATFGNTMAGDYRQNAVSEIVRRYETVTDRILHALEINEVDNPRSHITYSFRMLGDYHDDAFNRKEIVEVDYEALRENPESFPWENYGWVQAFQPLVDVLGFTIVEIDSEYQSFGQVPEQTVEYVAPFYRIYEGGHPDDVRGGFTSERTRQKKSAPPGFFDQYIAPIGQVMKENAGQLAGLAVTAATLVVMVRATNVMIHDLETKTLEANEVLRHIEDMVDDALDMPQVVKVELGDDIEVIGQGRHTW